MSDNSAFDAAPEAPTADWVRIDELMNDPFPSFERLRAEGGVHWVPAIGRYLVTSYDAVHTTELDQEIYSANEQGSLMIRAMGHSMLRRDDSEHFVERKAWEPALRPGVVKRVWTEKFDRNADLHLDALIAKGPGADFIIDFAAPYVADSLRDVFGLYNCTAEDLIRWSQTMIDATGNYADDPEVWAAGERSFNEVDDALDDMLVWHQQHPDESVISQLLRIPDYEMPLERIRANLKMTIGGGLNEPRDALGTAVMALLQHPEQRDAVLADPSLWQTVFDETIRWVAPIGMYSRQVTRDTVLAGVRLPRGAKLGISLLSANRDTAVWEGAAEFDIHREVQPHLAFGKGVHVCLGAWVARAEVANVALPKVFARLPELSLIAERPPVSQGWVFRGVTTMPLNWDAAGAVTADAAAALEAETSEAPTPTPAIAIIGSGPAGCFSAQALRRPFPGAHLPVFDRLPAPYGLVRSGVAADHQGTKSVARQFECLFVRDGVHFHGGVEIADQEALAALREQFDAVVVATGLSGDRTLGVAGADLPGIYGAGRITRLLNAHPDEAAAPQLGERLVIVGHGNVAIDLVRLIGRAECDFDGTDVHDEARRQLAGQVRRIHIVGRSLPEAAKFDPVMIRELAALDGMSHVVHGAELEAVAPGKDARVDAVRDLAAAVRPDAPVVVEWWFGLTPARLEGKDAVERAVFTGTEGEIALDTDSVITAVGFCGEGELLVEPGAHPDGRVEPGLYVAGWLRRGPRGTIPDQRSDARGLAALVAADIGASSRDSFAYAPPAGATDFTGWQRIDRAERLAAAAGRVRAKFTSVEAMLAAANDPRFDPPVDEASAATMLRLPAEGVTILVGSDSGNAELTADQLASELRGASQGGGSDTPITVRDLGSFTPTELDRAQLHLIVCSTYGDGELPTNAREFTAALADADLAGLRFAVFGMGDKSYTKTYSRGSELLSEALERAGAERLGEYGRHDAGSGDDPAELALDWAAALLDDYAAAIVG